MAKKLFVGNLPFAMNDAQLSEIFSAYGTIVSANIVIDKYANRSKGFGFVEFENEEDAAKAMAALNNSEQMGRNIAVKEALPRPEKTNDQ
jgi:RNA recognition motif-containing protein